jgi:hypothetical protein
MTPIQPSQPIQSVPQALPVAVSAKVPPKFVPTLTEVVQLPGGKLSAPVRVPSVPPLPSRAPTEGAELSEGVHTAPAALEPLPADDRVNLGDLLIHRVMQRVDEHLARDLRVAVAQLVVTHVQSLTPLLRDEIDRIVRSSVETALAKELSVSAGLKSP